MTIDEVTAQYPLPAGLIWERRGDRWVVVASPWTTTPPTVPGYYLVWWVEGLPPEVWELTEDGEWIDKEDRIRASFPEGAQFTPCPMPGV